MQIHIKCFEVIHLRNNILVLKWKNGQEQNCFTAKHGEMRQFVMT